MIGETLARKYKVVGLLGEGGMGSVYEAEHVGTGQRVAIKLIKAEKLTAGAGAASRFRREARVASALKSPHIVQLLESGVDEATKSLFIVMEYLEGEDLQRLLEREGPLPPDIVARIAVQALAGIVTAHEANIIHRDIKPANLFLARDAEGNVTVKLLDFGIAKIRADPADMPHTTGLTNTGNTLGSPLYMSPEQVQSSKDVDQPTDIWSVGCTLYAALTGSAPHQDVQSVGGLFVAICGTPALPVQERAPWVPQALADVVQKALAIPPELRHPSAAAMLDAIRELTPGGVALRQEMLVGLGRKRSGKPNLEETETANDEWHVIRVESSKPVLGEATTFQQVALPTRARSGRRRAWGAAGAALVVGSAAAGVYMLARPVATPEVLSNPLESSVQVALASSPTAVAPHPSAAPKPVRRGVLEVSPPDATVEVHGVRVPVSGGGVAIEGALESVHKVRVFKGENERWEDVRITEDGLRPSRVDLPPPKVAPGKVPTAKPRGSDFTASSPPPPPPPKPEDFLMPQEPPP